MNYYLITLVFGLSFIVFIYITELFIIPKLNDDSKFLKFWRRHIIGIDPFEK